MGHSSIEITVDIDGHLVPGANIRFVDRLDAVTTPQQSATPGQHDVRSEFDEFRQVIDKNWLGRTDSNRDTQIQSLQSYR
jgi:hypothetical protein